MQGGDSGRVEGSSTAPFHSDRRLARTMRFMAQDPVCVGYHPSAKTAIEGPGNLGRNFSGSGIGADERQVDEGETTAVQVNHDIGRLDEGGPDGMGEPSRRTSIGIAGKSAVQVGVIVRGPALPGLPGPDIDDRQEGEPTGERRPIKRGEPSLKSGGSFIFVPVDAGRDEKVRAGSPAAGFPDRQGRKVGRAGWRPKVRPLAGQGRIHAS